MRGHGGGIGIRLRLIFQDDIGRDRFDLLTVTVLVDCELFLAFGMRGHGGGIGIRLRLIFQDDIGRDRFDLLTVTVLVDCEQGIMRLVRRATKSVGRNDDPVSLSMAPSTVLRTQTSVSPPETTSASTERP